MDWNVFWQIVIPFCLGGIIGHIIVHLLLMLKEK